MSLHMLQSPGSDLVRQVVAGLALGLGLNLALWLAALVYTLDVIDETRPGGELRRAMLWLCGKLG